MAELATETHGCSDSGGEAQLHHTNEHDRALQCCTILLHGWILHKRSSSEEHSAPTSGSGRDLATAATPQGRGALLTPPPGGTTPPGSRPAPRYKNAPQGLKRLLGVPLLVRWTRCRWWRASCACFRAPQPARLRVPWQIATCPLSYRRHLASILFRLN